MLEQETLRGNPLETPCPACRVTAGYIGWGSYTRTIVFKNWTNPRYRVRRVRCRHCGATHAVLGFGILPYAVRSRGLHAAVLAAWASGRSNSEVRDMYDIPETTRRRMLSDARRRAAALSKAGAPRQQVSSALVASGLPPVGGRGHASPDGANITWRMAPARGEGDTVP